MMKSQVVPFGLFRLLWSLSSTVAIFKDRSAVKCENNNKIRQKFKLQTNSSKALPKLWCEKKPTKRQMKINNFYQQQQKEQDILAKRTRETFQIFRTKSI